MKTTILLYFFAAILIIGSLDSCTCSKNCPVDWRPQAFAPVFYGYMDYESPPSDVSPGDSLRGFPQGKCRVYYPSLDGSPQGAPPLEECCKYPLVIMIHGHCQGNTGEHYKKWFLQPAQLARSGYVVLVPSLPAIGGTTPNQGVIPVIDSFRTWLLNSWDYHELVHANTGIIGHSFGAPIGAIISKANEHVKAFVSLSGQYEGVNDYTTMRKPVLFMTGDQTADFAESLVGFNWNGTPPPKHKAKFNGGFHFDYVHGQVQCTNSFGSGTCSKVPQLSTELITMFFTRYLRKVSGIDPDVPPSLIPPDITLSTDQQFYAGGAYLTGFDNLGSDCSVELEWETADGNGSVVVP